MHPKVEQAFEEIDAGVFSGDMLWVQEDREKFMHYLNRWVRAAEYHEEYTSKEEDEHAVEVSKPGGAGVPIAGGAHDPA